MNLTDHPSVKSFRAKADAGVAKAAPRPLDADRLRALCLEAGADDVGLLEIGDKALDDQREDILRFFPETKTLVSFVCRMNREPIRSPARTAANIESHRTADRVNEVAHNIVAAMEQEGVRAINPPMAFPMEMSSWPGKTWLVSHKPVAVAAGLGYMGHHRLVVHPRFGSYVLLGTVLLAAEAGSYDRPLEYNPCLQCNLCVAACPTGAISPDGHFSFSACYTHAYRELVSGFTNWVEQIAESKSAVDYRRRVTDSESVFMWQSLTFGPNYRCGYCIAVCPAGEDVIGDYLTNKRDYLRNVVQPLRKKEEIVYVVPDSDAETHVVEHFRGKTVKRVGNSLRPLSIQGFLESLPLVFQRDRSAGVDATYHFTFTGEEEHRATISIRDRTLRVGEGHSGTAGLRVTADSRWWLGFVAKQHSLVWGLARRKLRLKGAPKLLSAFAKCFPS